MARIDGYKIRIHANMITLLCHSNLRQRWRIGIEHARGRLDAVVETLRLGEIISLHGSKQPCLQIGNHAL